MPLKVFTDDLSVNEKSKRRVSKKQDANLASERVGQHLHIIRKARRLSIRALAELSGLSVNTLSLIENGKTSPSVSTLHQLAQSLDVPITAFFEHEHPQKKIVYQRAGERQQLVFSQGQVESLSTGMPKMGSEPFITRLEPNANSGNAPIVYAGREFIYCLEGHITYTIENEDGPADLAKVLAHAVDNDSIVSGQRQPDGHVIYTSCRLFTDMQNAERFAREQKQTSVYNWNRYAEMPIKGATVPVSDDGDEDSEEA